MTLTDDSTQGRPLSIAMIGTRGLPATDGGVEMAVEALSRELVRRGHHVTVYGRRPYCDQRLHLHHGVRQIAIPVLNTKHLEAISHTALATSHAISRNDYDLIHFHAVGPSLLSWLPRTRKLPTVATVHASDWKREKWGATAKAVLRAGTKIASTVPDETIVVSRVLREFIKATYGRETHYIPNGVNGIATVSPAPIDGVGDRPFALFLGRIVPEKQVHLLVEAFARVAGDFELVIAGSSTHSDDYFQTVSQLAQMDDRVTMVGSRYGAEKAWLLQNAAVFVQPSTIEGQPIALLEALACDRTTIVSDIPEHIEVVTLDESHQPYGLTFRTGDAGDLANKLELALTRTPAAAESRPSEIVRLRYDWQRIAGETELVYRDAVASRASARRGQTTVGN